MLWTLLSACIGMRTSMQDASSSSHNGADSGRVDPSPADGSDLRRDMAVGDSRDVGADVGPVCGGTTTVDTRPLQADILILLDRSESMTWALNWDDTCTPDMKGCTTRADAVVPAVESVVTDNPDIDWGLELFPYPDKPACAVASVPQVAVGPHSAPAIRSLLASFTTAPSTPTAEAIIAATNYLKGLVDNRNKAILLATDGYPSCGYPTMNESVDQMLKDAVAAAAAAKESGFLLYVIGIGDSMDTLNNLARAGGTGSYYLATSTKELNDALKAIAKAFSPTCTFKADTIPPDKDLAAVYVDNQLVPEDDADGWAFDPADPTGATITLTGKYCEAVLAGTTSQVRIVFGCRQDASAVFMP